ncbi:MAG: tetratricopeptide repeat protein [bacterium]|nr:tetratricopeptide repeat protein [bacterium]
MRLFIAIFLSLTILAACQSPKEKSLMAIKDLEGNDSAFSNELMMQLKTAYVDFALTYPDDEQTPEFMFKAAQRSIVLQQDNEAVDLLLQITSKYPKSNYVEDATFLMAYTYENNLQDLVRAKAAYEEFLKKFPNGELAQDAKISLDNLGKTPEEILPSLNEDSISTSVLN